MYPSRSSAAVADAEDDVLAYMTFPQEHWTRIYSTDPLERLNKEVKRRTNVVGVFPDRFLPAPSHVPSGTVDKAGLDRAC
jgi:transposase-like protein